MPDNNAALKMSKKKKRTTIFEQVSVLENLIGGLPEQEDDIKIVSYSDLTPLAFLSYTSKRAVIRELSIVTFRVGPTALKTLNAFGRCGRILSARIVVGKIMEQDGRKTSAIKYWEDLCAVCARYGWTCAARNNHAKLMLMDTDVGRFVLEGSGNFNDAPNFEQYSFCRDDELYQFYAGCLDAIWDGRGLNLSPQASTSYVPHAPTWGTTKLNF